MSVRMKKIFMAAIVFAICIEPTFAGVNAVCANSPDQCASGSIIFIPKSLGEPGEMKKESEYQNTVSMKVATLCNFDKTISEGVVPGIQGHSVAHLAYICVRK